MRYRKKLGIVMVNYNGAQLTIDCINSLMKSTYMDFIIYLIDNGSTSEDVNKLEMYCNKQQQIEFLNTGSNNGIAKGNNIGVKKALDDNCEYIMLLNNDTIVDSQMLEKLMEDAESGSELSTPLMCYFDEPTKIWCAGGKFNRFKGTTTHFYEKQYIENVELKKCRIDYVPTCCLLVKANLFKQYGMFDEDYFMYYDDTDFIFRLNRLGKKINFIPSAKLWHKVSSSSGGAESKLSIYYGNRNRLYFIHKNITGVNKPVSLLFTYGTRILKILKSKHRTAIIEGIVDYHKKNMGWKDISKI